MYFKIFKNLKLSETKGDVIVYIEIQTPGKDTYY